ncbi:MAG: CPBP family intramembrane glutamic endopeptidase [Acidimicrobiales bacterium]
MAVWIEDLTEETQNASAQSSLSTPGDTGLTVWVVLFAFLAATAIPVIEELVFRGLFWSALEKRGLRPVPILLVTSVVFAAIHLELLRTPVLIVLGIGLGFCRMLTGRLGPAIVMHMGINTIGMLAVLAELA